MLWISVGTGLVISFLFAEWMGLAAGGLVVPGYIALFLNKPIAILGTLVAALLAFVLLRILSSFTILYGRRRLVMAVMLGFLMTAIFKVAAISNLIAGFGTSVATIGFIIPGLLAYWMDKQGIWDTLAILFIAAPVVRFIVILISGGDPSVLAL